MKRFFACSLALAAGFLSACGGGSDPATDPAHFAGPDDSMATRISAATSLEDAATFETTAKALQLDFDADATTQLPDEPMTVRLFRTSPTAAPTLVMETEQGEHSFGPEDLDQWGNFSKENSGSWTTSGSWLSHANGYRIREDGAFTNDAGQRIDPQSFKHHVPFTVWAWNEETEIGLRHMAVIGLETSPGDMPQSRTAYYNGYGQVDLHRVDDPGDRTRFGVDEVNLTANFDDGTVSGRLDEWVLWQDDGSGVLTEISYDLLPASIDGNGFLASLAPSASCAFSGNACPAVPDSSVAGKFYGPYAAEAAGTIETGGFADSEGVNWIGIGAFNTAEE